MALSTPQVTLQSLLCLYNRLPQSATTIFDHYRQYGNLSQVLQLTRSAFLFSVMVLSKTHYEQKFSVIVTIFYRFRQYSNPSQVLKLTRFAFLFSVMVLNKIHYEQKFSVIIITLLFIIIHWAPNPDPAQLFKL